MGVIDTEQLLSRAAAGDTVAIDHLFASHRDRLRRMIGVHLDAELLSRIDPSDIVQDTYTEAARRFPEYLQERPIPFYPWLRQLAWDRLVQLRRKHAQAHWRSVRREVANDMFLSDHSATQLADRLAARGSSPSRQAVRVEMRRRLRAALDCLASPDREVLVLRFLEQLSTRETAAVLGTSEVAARVRQLRALQRLQQILGDNSLE